MSPSHVPPSARRSAFAPLHDGDRVAAVERRIADAIRAGVLRDGEQLPSELELASQLGVSPMTLREALAGLRRSGLVHTRRGRGGGTFVRVSPDATRTHLLARLGALPVDDLRDLGDHHAALAAHAAQLAAQRATAPDIELLRHHVETLAAVTDVSARQGADRRFHVELAAAARSPRLTAAESATQLELGALVWLVASAHDAATAVAEHRAILSAVQRGDTAGARATTVEHVARETDRLVAARLELEPRGRGRPRSHQAAARAVLDPLVDTLHGVLEGLEELRGATIELTAAAAQAGRAPARAELGSVRAIVQHHLAERPDPIIGTGVVFALDVLADAPRWLEWWWTPEGRSPVPLETVLDPSDARFYDYERAEWFAMPRERRERWVAGPFVDYSGTDRHIFTITIPIVHERRFLGVAGADVTASRIEALAAPTLRAISEPAVLVNRRGRVIAANRSLWLPGTLCAEALADRTPAGTTRVCDPRLEWSVLVGLPSRAAGGRRESSGSRSNVP